ncbi:hypothetical protein CAOG_05865 [Capsaspora owczarzaki ATCC 30864]|uniref:Inhibitor of growth protein n=1 Tax=Capsaspora owczarzaki (strain ATCC 30864) TaxID=595528 RepID=A0A0D2UJY0_CAPO3|nr:hypothetical protein CAOG_05865 [Capsaspora owczarzaki ATCC 30864]KJE95411.1 hypothetical protein CAOG_005865 [Capsaspora owczarzaki ATCC 30864]|eukprot:XP_004345455.1 hypothetical protein CAOG_05865 [Capsaspora owczarzaki ATCC 30864]
MARPAVTAQYLQQFLTTIESLPYDLQRNFTLIRELDARTHEALRMVEQLCPALADKSLPQDEIIQKIRGIQEHFRRCLEFGDDKIQIAAQSYELVDKHIQRLDADVEHVRQVADIDHDDGNARKKSRMSVEDDRSSGYGKKLNRAAQGSKANAKDQAPPLTVGAHAAALAARAGGARQLGNNNRGTARSPGVDVDMPVDPNEPVYCVCHQVSYGEMIGCDNPDCITEWFHFQCVNLTAKPKGKWYCPQCTELKKKGLIK